MSQMTFPKFLAQLDVLPDSLKITQKHVAAISMLLAGIAVVSGLSLRRHTTT